MGEIVEAPTKEQVHALSEAMWLLLDDMGVKGCGVCLYAKAQARIAFEPFRDPEVDVDDWMALAEAERIVAEVNQ